MKVFKTLLFSVFSIAFIILMYYNTNYYIGKQFWKIVSANRGFRVSDFLNFDNKETTLSGRTILIDGKPKAYLVFCWGKGMIIRDAKSKATGAYCNKDYWF